MRVFIARKKINLKHYLIIILILVLIMINILINLFLKHVDNTKLLNIITLNSGFKFNNNNSLTNIFGVPLEEYYNSAPIVYLYNTFQTDKYTNNSNNSYSINPSIKEVNLILAEELKKYNINCLTETESISKIEEDNALPYTDNYKASRILMVIAKNNYPSLNYFIDIGLSEEEKNTTTFIDNNESFAKILFIIGTNYNTYLDNKREATILDEKIKSINQNISRGISLRSNSSYNQDFSSTTFRIFIGGKENTIDEVNNTIKILAKALSEYIKENKNAKE